MIKHQYRMSDLHTIKDLTCWRAAWSEYFRGETIHAVASEFPNKLSKTLSSEYLLGNVVHAVADLLHGTVV